MHTTPANAMFSREKLRNAACSCCGESMSLSCISVGLDGYDLGTFECEKCDRSKSVVVHIPPD